MSILDPIKPAEMARDFTHWGTIHGWVPVVMGDLDSEAPRVAVRNGYPDFLEPLGRYLWIGFGHLFAWLVPGFEVPLWKFEVMGEVRVERAP